MLCSTVKTVKTKIKKEQKLNKCWSECGELEHLYFAGRKVKWYSYSGETFEFLMWLGNPIPRYLTKKAACMHMHAVYKMLIAALIAEKQKQHKVHQQPSG